MKIIVDCNSPLNQDIFESYLKGHLVAPTSDDFELILTDKNKDYFKNVPIDKIIDISYSKDSDLKRPFSKKELLIQLRVFLEKKSHLGKLQTVFSGNELNELEIEISRITKIYLEEVHKIIREFYENKNRF